MLPIKVVLCFSPGEQDQQTLTSLPRFLPTATQADSTAGGWDSQAHPLLSSAPEASNVCFFRKAGHAIASRQGAI